MRITKASLCFDREGKRREFIIEDMNGVAHIDIADANGYYGSRETGSVCADLKSDEVRNGFIFVDRAQFVPPAHIEEPKPAELPIMDGTYTGSVGLGDAISGLALAMLSHPGDTFRVTVVRQ